MYNAGVKVECLNFVRITVLFLTFLAVCCQCNICDNDVDITICSIVDWAFVELNNCLCSHLFVVVMKHCCLDVFQRYKLYTG